MHWNEVTPNTMPKPGVPVLLKFKGQPRQNDGIITHKKVDEAIVYSSCIGYAVGFLVATRDGFDVQHPLSFQGFHFKLEEGVKTVVHNGVIQFKHVESWVYLEELDASLIFSADTVEAL